MHLPVESAPLVVTGEDIIERLQNYKASLNIHVHIHEASR